MASALSHPAVPLAIAVAAGSAAVPPAVTAVACAASILPDADAVGFWAGIPYDAPLGHRGFTHSLFFALLVAIACSFLAPRLSAPASTVFAVVFVATASHGALDALTTGGMGVAFFSPFSNARFFWPWRPIRVSPIGIAPFLSAWGIAVLKSELLWIWTPCAAAAGVGYLARRTLHAG
ncbi:MAG: metal-dependent hydrolase [Syntrophomonadaceae bacterium]